MPIDASQVPVLLAAARRAETPQKAIYLLSAVTTVDPTNLTAWFAMGNTYVRQVCARTSFATAIWSVTIASSAFAC
mgnify:CR=1 FL=1